MSINSVCVSGNLTRDPELRQIPSGTSVLSFSVAVNDRRKDASTGEWRDFPNFIDAVVFGNRSEPLARILRKGSKISLHGKLRQSQWETQDGQKRSKVEIVADEVELMQQKPEEDRSSMDDGSIYDGSIPF